MSDLYRRWAAALCITIILSVVYLFWQHKLEAERAIVIKREQANNYGEWSKYLNISGSDNKELQAAYERQKPASFSIQAPTLDKASKQLAELINRQDNSLPPAVLEKTDKTAVVENMPEFKVDVLKINLDKPWEVSTGVGSHEGEIYLPIGIQRNYAPDKAVAVEIHLNPEEAAQGKIKTSGWEVKNVWRF